MSYQVLARKYRPQQFSEVIGQEHVTRTLRNAIEQQRIAHGYIFSGHRGIGKTTIARILAMALNCRSSDHPVPEPCGQCDSCSEIRAGNSVDVIEIDAATNRGIDEIRELREAARYRPARDRFKIYILDEAHQITDAAFNALLKTLEEPPGHVIFMMATTQPEDIPQTIRSRCQNFSFHAVRFEEIVDQLRSIARQENIPAEESALAVLAEAGDGSMRDALSIMDQAIASSGERLTGEAVRQLVGAVSSELLEQIMNSVAGGSSQETLRQLDQLLREGQNPSHFARQLVRFLRDAIVAKVAGKESPVLQISADERERASRVAEQFSEEDLARFLQIMLRTHNELGYKQEQRFHLELGLLKMVHAARLLPIEELLSAAAGPGGSPPGGKSGVSSPRPEAAGGPPARPGAPLREVAAARPSPFEADRARKSPDPAPPKPGTAKMMAPAPVLAGALAAAADPAAETEPAAAVPAADTVQELRSRVLEALQNANCKGTILLEEGEWDLRGGELTVRVGAPEVVAEMTLSAEAKRLASQAASQAAGRPLRLRILGGGANGAAFKAERPNPPPGTARARAAEDPVVQRMQEKFGAQVRTVIDHREKR